ncbi:MAG: hypothetical protein C0513_00605 [Isosphaera sp.]|nr:hypothetical protein [Isosphaera sp.]
MARAIGSGRVRTERVLRRAASAGLDADGVARSVLWVMQLAGCVFVAAALWSFSIDDWPSGSVWPHAPGTRNWCGRAGAWVAYRMLHALDYGAWALAGLWALHVVVTGFVSRVGQTVARALGAALMAASVAGLQRLLGEGSGAIPDLSGGVIGSVAHAELTGRFGGLGAFLILGVALLVGAVVTLDAWVFIVPAWAWGRLRAAAPPVASATATAATKTAGAWARWIQWARARLARPSKAQSAAATHKKKRRAAQQQPAAPAAIDENAGGLGGTEAFDPDQSLAQPEAPAAAQPAEAPRAAPAPEIKPAAQALTPEQLRAKISKLPLRFAASGKKAATEEDLRDVQNQTDLEGYRFPGVDLLEEPEPGYGVKLEAFVRDQASALERALREYRIDGEVVGIDSGPVITFYEIRLAAGTKVAALQSVASDLARSLRAVNIRIVPNTAGRDTVGIEVPNPHKEKVRLKELMGKSEVYGGMSLPMFLGKDAAGNPLIADLSKMPHMLIAGTTGSGKSVCMGSILMSFLYTKKPNELKLVLVDPKMVELSQFKDVPHLMCPVVTEMGKAAAILEWAVRKMDERYELLMEAGCRDIGAYNALSWEELRERFAPADEAEEARIPKKLPFIVFVIDELADLMMTNKEVEGSIVRIAQKARAVGIHLIVATQRPQANVVTGLIKANMPSRVCFKVASGMDSRIVMDQKGGELLLGQGDMLFLSPRSSELARAQGTLVDDKEIRKVVKFLREVAEPTFERSLMQIRTGSAAAGGLEGDESPEGTIDHDGLTAAQADPLFDKAVDIALETKIGSVSMLQRRLAIGYTRASRLIDAMGKAGILGDHKGTVAREVLISPDVWEQMKAQAAADASGSAGQEDGLFAGPSPDNQPQPSEPPADEAPDGLGSDDHEPGSPDESDESDENDENADADAEAPPFETDEPVRSPRR